MIPGIDIGVGDVAVTAAPKDGVATEIVIIDMKIKIAAVVKVKVEENLMIIRDEVKKTFRGEGEGHGKTMREVIVIVIIAKETMMAKITVIEAGDGMATGDKVMVTEAEVDDGMKTPNIHNKTTLKTIHCQIITSPHRWDGNTSTNCHMSNTRLTLNRLNSTTKGHPHNHARPQTYASYAKIKATMIINANSQAISWPEHKRHLIRAVPIIIKNQIKGIGQMGITTMTTLMANLFSSGGS